MAVLTVGSGGTYATLPAAFAAVTSGAGDVMRLVSDVTINPWVDMNGKNSWQLDFNGYTLTRDGTGHSDGLFLWDCNDVQIYGPGLLTTAAGPLRSATYGGGITCGPNCAYVLIENLEISYFTQHGVGGLPGITPKWQNPSRAYEGCEYIWINNCDIHDIDPNETFEFDGSVISFLVPYNAADRSEPVWWQQKINAEINPTPPVGRNWSDCMMLITNCDLSNYVAPTNAEDSDQNAIIYDEWTDGFYSTWFGYPSRSHSYPRIRPNGWGLTCNNIAKNCRGAAWRYFNTNEAGYGPQRHVCVFNTSDDVGQRPYGVPRPGDPYDSESASIHVADQLGPVYHGMLISSNLMVNSGNAGGEQWVLSQSGAMGNQWVANHQHNMTDTAAPGYPGIYQSSGDPLIDANYVPQAGSPLLGAGNITWVPLYDKNGTPRNQKAPTIGALEQTAAPQPPVASFTHSASGLTVDFTDTSTNSPTSWAWTFGDGNTDTAQNPQHTYATDGVYTVTLTATNAQGSSAPYQTQVSVFVPQPGALEVVSVTDVWTGYGVPWDITVPTVADGDVLYIAGTTRDANATQSGARILGDPSTIGFTEHYSAFTLGQWHSEGFGVYKTMTAAESGTTITIPKVLPNEPLSSQLYVLRNVESFESAVWAGGVETSGVINTPSIPDAPEDGDLEVWIWHVQNLTPANSTSIGTPELHTDNGTLYHLGHSAWEPKSGPAPEPVNGLFYGPPTTTDYHAATFLVRSTYVPPEPPPPTATITGSALLF